MTVKVGVIGMGFIGGRHAAILASLSNCELVVCCDSNPAMKSRVPPGVRFSDSIEEALESEGLEAVFVCTPESDHRDAVIRALVLGCAVFCEKPMASSLADIEAMITAANGAAKPLVVGHVLRFDPRYLAVKRAVEAGSLGRILRMSARRMVGLPEGRAVSGRTSLPLYLGVHDIDVFRWLAGEIVEVFGYASHLGIISDDAAEGVVASVKFDSGAIAQLELSWSEIGGSMLQSDAALVVTGTEGSATVAGGLPESVLATASGLEFIDAHLWPDIYGSPTGILRNQDEHFIRSIQGGSPWPLSLGDARSAVEVALAIDRSLQRNEPARVGATATDR